MILFPPAWVRLGDVRDGLAPPQVFNAVPPSPISAPAELVPQVLNVAWKLSAALWLRHFVFAVIVAGRISSQALKVIIKPTTFCRPFPFPYFIKIR